MKNTIFAKKCLVGYKTIWDDDRLYGYSFDRLQLCCETFRVWFEESRLRKNYDDSLSADCPNGINLVSSGEDKKVVLRNFNEPDKHGDSVGLENEIKFCPFCGAEIKIQETKVVELIEDDKKNIEEWDEKIIKEKPFEEEDDGPMPPDSYMHF